MDPHETWHEFLDLVQAQQTEEAADLAERFMVWLDRGGTAPQVSLLHRLPEIFCRLVVRAACEVVLEQAGREFS